MDIFPAFAHMDGESASSSSMYTKFIFASGDFKSGRTFPEKIRKVFMLNSGSSAAGAYPYPHILSNPTSKFRYYSYNNFSDRTSYDYITIADNTIRTFAYRETTTSLAGTSPAGILFMMVCF